MLQYGANLLNRDAGEPLNELRYERAVFEVLEERCHRHSSAAKHPSPTHALRIAFDGRACGPINHDVNDTTRTQTTKTANAHANRAPRSEATRVPKSAALGRSGSACCWASSQVKFRLGAPGWCIHRMISSVSTRIDSGTLIPSASAVLRLRTSSNFVGCSIGKSPAFAPFRILSTYTALRLNICRRSTE